MAQSDKPAGRSGKDPYAQRTKQLASTAQKVRGWVGSDPSRAAELADALVELTAHRLLGHGYAAAATDAQEAVKLSAQLLTANGPIGPYTDLADAVRYVAAVVQLAAVQVGLGLPDAAGRSVASLGELREQLGAATLAEASAPRTSVWALLAGGRAALAAGDVAGANAYADAAQDRLADAGLADDHEAGYLVLDADRLTADARWAAGGTDAALRHQIAARLRYDAEVYGRLTEPARLSEGLRDRLAEPLPGVYGDLADRLAAVGDLELALSVRRELVTTLRALGKRAPETVCGSLAVALAGWAVDLRAAGRDDEAERAAAEAHDLDPTAEAVRRPAGALAGWAALKPADAFAAVATGSGRRGREAALIAETTAWRDAARAEAELSEAALRRAAVEEADARRATEEAARAAEAEREARERAATERAAQAEAAERAAAQQAEREERKRRRAERLEEHRRIEQQEAAEKRAALQAEYDRLAAERGTGGPAGPDDHELVVLRAQLDELAERERRAAAAVVAAADAEGGQDAEDAEAVVEDVGNTVDAAPDEPAEAEVGQPAEAEGAEPAEAEVDEQRPAQVEDQVATPIETDDALDDQTRDQTGDQTGEVTAQREDDLLDQAQRELLDARSRTDRRAVRAANERVVELLRPRAEADLERYGPTLVAALEELSRARLRGGDLFGSRGSAKEAKALARRLGA